MNDHQRDPGGDGGEKRGGAVDRTRQHGAEKHDEKRIERSLLRQRSPVADANHRQSGEENKKSAKRNVEHRQLGRFAVGTEKDEEEILERVHENGSPARGTVRVSKSPDAR